MPHDNIPFARRQLKIFLRTCQGKKRVAKAMQPMAWVGIVPVIEKVIVQQGPAQQRSTVDRNAGTAQALGKGQARPRYRSHMCIDRHVAMLDKLVRQVQAARLGQLAEERFPRRAGIEGFRLPDGRVLNVLAEGRLVNLAAGNGHPAEIMDMSFAVQALSLEWMARHARMLEKKVYNVPEEIDDQIGRVKLAAMGLSIDTLTQEQKDYLAGWEA